MQTPTRIIALVASSLLFSNVSADTAPEDNIIVSAYRTPATNMDVGSAVSTISQPTIQNRQSIFATDLLQDLPSVAVSRDGNFGSQTGIRIRGAEANHVLVRIDGIEVNDPATGDAYGFAHLTTHDIERIEVIRGPQSAVWGSDALAGVIDITTRRSKGPVNIGGFVEGGSFDTFSGGFNAGTRTDTAGIDLSASYLDTDGTNISRTGSEDDGYKNLTAKLLGDWQVTPALGLDTSIRLNDSKKEFDAIDFQTGLPGDSDSETEASQTIVGVGSDLTLFDEFWTQSLQFNFMSTDNDNFLNGSNETSTAADKYGIYYQSNLNIGSGPTEDAAQKISLAVDYEREEFEQRGQITSCDIPFCDPPEIFDPNQDQSMNNLGLVGEYRATDFGGLSFSAGLRFDANSEFDNITTWRTTAAYRITSLDSRVHASAGTGQKSPTFSERFGFYPDQFIGNPDLKPEKSKGFDIGYEQKFTNLNAVIDITYFRERLEDEIDSFFFDVSQGAFTAVNKDGTSKSKGIELELSTKWSENLSAYASYTYTDASQPNTLTAEQEQEIRRPRHMAALNLNYEFLRDKAQINLNFSYSGDQTDTFFPPYPQPQETVVLDAYTLVNLSSSFAMTDEITIYGRIENLFDETYENVFGYATPGIGGYVGARMNFGK